MKRITLSVLLLLLCASVQAREVDVNTARRVAAGFWNIYHPKDVKPVSMSDMVPMVYDGYSHLHVFTVGQEGFVIIAGDDRVSPVLAYSFDSPFPKTLHASLRYWLGGYESQLAELAASDAERPAEATAAWRKFSSAKDTTTTDTVPVLLNVPALVETRWDQGDPYNRYCPFDTNYNARTVVGCVATAMAQIIRFWKYPSCGTGSYSYVPRSQGIMTDTGYFEYDYGTQTADFAHTTYIYEYMPRVVSTNVSYEYQIKAAAKLSYHCGVAVNMQYGTTRMGGSGASSDYAATALVDYFRYNPGLQRMYRYDVEDSVWKAMIDEDIAAGRPVYYTGRDSTGGHAFVLDGADVQGRYHFNLGWGGTGDGFYRVDAINIGTGGAGGNATYTFNRAQSAIFGIEPMPVQMDTVDYYDTVCPDESRYYFHDYDLPAQNGEYYCVHLDTVYRVHLNKAQRRYIYLNPNGGTGSMITQKFCYLNGVVMPECTFTREGYRFIGWCSRANGNGDVYQAGDTVWTRRSLNLYAIWESENLGIVGQTSVDVQLSPNPTTGEIYVTVSGSREAELTVLDILGRAVLRETVSGKAKISLQSLPTGAYTVQVKTAEGVCNRRVIKR